MGQVAAIDIEQFVLQFRDAKGFIAQCLVKRNDLDVRFPLDFFQEFMSKRKVFEVVIARDITFVVGSADNKFSLRGSFKARANIEIS